MYNICPEARREKEGRLTNVVRSLRFFATFWHKFGKFVTCRELSLKMDNACETSARNLTN